MVGLTMPPRRMKKRPRLIAACTILVQISPPASKASRSPFYAPIANITRLLRFAEDALISRLTLQICLQPLPQDDARSLFANKGLDDSDLA